MSEKNFLSGLEYMVMLSVLKHHGKAYGVIVYDEICENTGKDVAYGVVYRALKNLEAKGYLSSAKGEATQERGRRAITYYRINALGQKVLNEYEESVNKFKQYSPEPLLQGV